MYAAICSLMVTEVKHVSVNCKYNENRNYLKNDKLNETEILLEELNNDLIQRDHFLDHIIFPDYSSGIATLLLMYISMSNLYYVQYFMGTLPVNYALDLRKLSFQQKQSVHHISVMNLLFSLTASKGV